MGFEESARTRLRRCREEADRSLASIREAEERARGFSERLFAGLGYTATLAREAGFAAETKEWDDLLTLSVDAGSSSVSLTLGRIPGAAAETDEDLMHEELSHYSLDPSGYSARILGFSESVSEGPCQIFAVYRDGVWKTKGVFVERARGKNDDPDEVLNGFCLRILGRLVDLAALTGGAGLGWASRASYTLDDLSRGETFPTTLRLPR